MVDGSALEGFWLPALDGRRLDIKERAFGPGQVPLALPALTPELLRHSLIEAQDARARFLAERPVAELLRAIAAAAGLLTRPGERYREELLAVLPEITGYSRRMIEIGLERMGEGWTESALTAALKAEFDCIEVLDDFQPREGGGLHRAYGPSLTVHFFSGNIPGVSVTSLIRGLCVKSASFGKTAAGEPYSAVCFARALAEVDRELASCLAVTYWPGGNEELEAIAFAEAEAVIAYGSDATIADIKRRLPPHARFVPYPNRVGAALVARSALNRAHAPQLAQSAARDVASFDQQGCVSPHIIFVERGGEVGAREFAEALAQSLEQLSREIPRKSLTPAESTSIHQLRAQAEMRGATVLASAGGTAWTVIVEERPQFEPSVLNRVIYVRPVDDFSVPLRELARVGRHLQTVAVEGEPSEVKALARRLGAAGATRIVPLGATAWPAPHWHHDGRFQFLDLVRFTDIEQP